MSTGSDSKKRSAPSEGSSKRGKKGKYYDTGFKLRQTLTGIENGTQGIFATCNKGKEARCVEELYRIFDKYTEQIYGVQREKQLHLGNAEDGTRNDDELDIEAMMAKELESIRDTGNGKGKLKNMAAEDKLFISVKLDTPCVVYFRTNPPISPSSFVHAICEDTLTSGVKQSRWTNRLTPIERTGKATIEGIEEIAKHVLKPWFHEGQAGVNFAIRPSIRNHDVLTRDLIIGTVASCVGPGHKVDLKEYDLLILVEVYKNVCGMSVVKDWEKLKRFNLAQIQDDRKIAAEVNSGSSAQ
ncbi:hypothetical protein BDZ91DRAFT_721589 [Kalaharituber pfeilii]|nr:hypothetical protein BDZ91DRAFT_721589 [Kalaharituber pfeilii]